MKQCLLTILFFTVMGLIPCVAQVPSEQGPPVVDPAVRQARLQELEGLKLAYIKQQLNLSPEEERQFVPVYNQYLNELGNARYNNRLADPLTRDAAILEVRRKYQDQFTRMLGATRTNHFFQSERDFNRVLLNRLNHRFTPARIPMERPLPRRLH
jgi:hypothetical protein